MPCYAGWASTHIAPNGDVWTCAVRAQPIANLRDYDFDFKKIWFGNEASPLRQSIKKQECACPLANAAFTSMLMDPQTLVGVGADMMHEMRKERGHGSTSRTAAPVRRS